MGDLLLLYEYTKTEFGSIIYRENIINNNLQNCGEKDARSSASLMNRRVLSIFLKINAYTLAKHFRPHMLIPIYSNFSVEHNIPHNSF